MTNKYVANIDEAGKIQWGVGDVPKPKIQPQNAAGYEGPLHPEALSIAEVQKLLGYQKWNALTAEQRKAAASTFPSEIDGHDVTMFFGSKSDSAAANRLAMKNPVAYKLLRKRAQAEGIIA